MTIAESPLSGPTVSSRPLLDLGERQLLALRLALSMVAAGLISISLGWQLFIPEERYISDITAAIAALLVAIPVFTAAWQSLRRPTLHGVSDQLVALSMMAAWATGELVTAAVLPIVMIIGHILEERSLLGSRASIAALSRLVEGTARKIRDDGSIRQVPIPLLAVGDRIDLRPGDKVPADGVIRRGSSSVDTASLTGESIPQEVVEGDHVMAGSINLYGPLEIELSRVGGDTTLGQVINLMKVAEEAKPPITRLIEQYAGQYIGLVLVIAAGAWFATGNSNTMLAILVASCPCALVLAAPATAIAAITVAARHGILIKGAGFLEQLAGVDSLILDKTGTVTLGELRLTQIVTCSTYGPDEVVRLAGALGQHSTHPVSQALARLQDAAASLPLTDIREERGLGVHAQLDGKMIALGRVAFFQSMGISPAPLPDHDGPVAGLCMGDTFLAWFLLADEPRAEAAVALQSLRDLGLTRQILLTGDRASVARKVGSDLGIQIIHAEKLPEQKMRCVLDEAAKNLRPMVVGDGINDALALKAGAVGVAMGAQGTDVALASADIVLMSSDLRRLATSLRLARRCRTGIHVNVAIGIGWTVALVAASAAGWLGYQGPIWVALLHNVGTLGGLANAARLLRFEDRLAPANTEAVIPC